MSDDPSTIPGGPADEDLPALTSEAKNWGVLCHLAALLGFVPPTLVIGAIVGPLVVWLFKGKHHPFIEENAKESLNFQISVLIYSVLLSLTLCFGVGLVLLPVLWIVDVIMIVTAALAASNGRAYRYHGSLRFIH